MTARLGTRIAAAALAGVLVAVPAATAAADDDLDRVLREAARAEYSGTVVMVTTWDGTRIAAVVEVEKSGSTIVIGSGDDRLTIVGDGSVHDGSGTVRMSGWATAVPTDRYEVRSTREVVVIGRPAVELLVTEDGERRAVVVVDEVTRAALATTVLDGDGAVFRQSVFTEFAAGAGEIEAAGGGPGYTMMITDPEFDLPADIGGYRLTDGYRDAAGVSQAYFTDGLFSFSVFDLAGDARLADSDGAVRIEVDGHGYDVVVEPSRVLVAWRAGDGDFLLVGDLPPDHLEDVLRQLPAPGSDGFLDRIWRSLFG